MFEQTRELFADADVVPDEIAERRELQLSDVGRTDKQDDPIPVQRLVGKGRISSRSLVRVALINPSRSPLAIILQAQFVGRCSKDTSLTHGGEDFLHDLDFKFLRYVLIACVR